MLTCAPNFWQSDINFTECSSRYQTAGLGFEPMHSRRTRIPKPCPATINLILSSKRSVKKSGFTWSRDRMNRRKRQWRVSSKALLRLKPRPVPPIPNKMNSTASGKSLTRVLKPWSPFLLRRSFRANYLRLCDVCALSCKYLIVSSL